MAFFLRGLLGLSVLGGAVTGIAFPANNAVQQIFNKQKIRKSGGNTKAGKDYEAYGYGDGGFGDDRTKKISNGQGTEEIKTALKNIREEWGKNKLGEGIEKNFSTGLKNKSLCRNGSSNNECHVGNIEFIEEKDKSLFGRIPLKDKDDKKVNVYVKGYKCKQNPKNASGIGFGGSRKQGANGKASNGKNGLDKYKGCLETTRSQ